jgi:nucleotide-binding universal stress UspA family protein
VGFTPLVLSPEMLVDIREAVHRRIGEVLTRVGTRAEEIVVEGRAAPTILALVEERRPELLVMATRGWTGFARILLGSVAEHVVRGARAPVLVVRLAR